MKGEKRKEFNLVRLDQSIRVYEDRNRGEREVTVLCHDKEGDSSLVTLTAHQSINLGKFLIDLGKMIVGRRD